MAGPARARASATPARSTGRSAVRRGSASAAPSPAARGRGRGTSASPRGAGFPPRHAGPARSRAWPGPAPGPGPCRSLPPRRRRRTAPNCPAGRRRSAPADDLREPASPIPATAPARPATSAAGGWRTRWRRAKLAAGAEPEGQRRLAPERHADVVPGRDPVAQFGHLPRHLAIAGLGGVHQRIAAQAQQADGEGQGEQEPGQRPAAQRPHGLAPPTCAGR